MTAGTTTSDTGGDSTRHPDQVMGRRELLFFVSLAMATMALGIDMMLPAFDEMRAAFDLDPDSTAIGQTVTVYFVGVAFSQLLWGPAADWYGRKPILLAGLAVTAIGAALSALAPSLTTLLIARFLWGLGAGGPRVIVTAIIRDTYVGDAMATAMSRVMAIFILVPIFAPAIGAGILVFLPWQGIFWTCMAFTGIVAIWSRRLHETLDPAARRPLEFSSFRTGVRRVMTTRLTALTMLASVFLQAVMTTYLTTSELIISEVYDRGDQFPFVFGAVAVVMGAASLLNGSIVSRVGMRIAIRRQAVVMTLGAIVLVVLASGQRPGFVLFHVVLAVTFGTFMMLMPSLGAAGMIQMGDMAGTASSVTAAMRLLVGSVMAGVATGLAGGTVFGFAACIGVFVLGAALTVLVMDRTVPPADWRAD